MNPIFFTTIVWPRPGLASGAKTGSGGSRALISLGPAAFFRYRTRPRNRPDLAPGQKFHLPLEWERDMKRLPNDRSERYGHKKGSHPQCNHRRGVEPLTHILDSQPVAPIGAGHPQHSRSALPVSTEHRWLSGRSAQPDIKSGRFWPWISIPPRIC